MEGLRAPLQGVRNIVRFNWPFYAFAALVVAGAFTASAMLPGLLGKVAFSSGVLAALVTAASLLVSAYVYDFSGLYQLDWLNGAAIETNGTIVNLHAGFDETSVLLRDRYRNASLRVLDFYDPEKHTEASVRRARETYPPFPGTQRVDACALPLDDSSADTIFLLFAAHEIRDEHERRRFFHELHRTLKSDGRIIVTEHLRDLPNFLAYTIGFLHFHSRATWLRTISTSGFRVAQQTKITPFVTTFILAHDRPQP